MKVVIFCLFVYPTYFSRKLFFWCEELSARQGERDPSCLQPCCRWSLEKKEIAERKVQFLAYVFELHPLLSLLIQMLRRKEISSSKRKPVHI